MPNNFRKLMRYLADTIKEPNKFAVQHGIPPAQLHNKLGAIRRLPEDKWFSPTLRNYCRWIDALGVELTTPEELVKLDPGYIYYPKIRAKLCAGGGSWEVDPEQTSALAFRSDWAREKRLGKDSVAMEVAGESMSPTIEDGDVVLIDPEQRELRSGLIYALAYGDVISVKRIERRLTGVLLKCDNAKFGEEEVSIELMETQLRILGRVVWVGRNI